MEGDIVTPPGILSPTSDRSLVERSIPFTDKVGAQLERALNQLVELVQPLPLVERGSQLRLELDRRAQEYLRVKNESWHLIVSELPENQVSQFVLSAYDEMSRLVSEDTKLLRPEERQLVLDSIQSFRELLQAIIEGSAEQPFLTDVLLECSAPLQRADMCLSAILLVLVGEIQRWAISGIRLLARMASSYTLQIEDIFLFHDIELNERLGMKDEIVGLEEVRQEIGL